jgi:hypothetical protein
MELERSGIPTVTFTADKFEVLATSVSRVIGMPDLKYVITPHPIVRLTPDEIASVALALYDKVRRAITRGSESIST